MPLDFKKEYKDLYMPKAKPVFIEVPPMTFFAVAGTGNPNEPDGAYAKALELLYGLSYAVKMSKMGAWQPEGYFDYVVPPLEGLWWAGAAAFDGTSIVDKGALSWVSLIRQPDFVTPEVFAWACAELAKKKPSLTEACERASGDMRKGFRIWCISPKGRAFRLCTAARMTTNPLPLRSYRPICATRDCFATLPRAANRPWGIERKEDSTPPPCFPRLIRTAPCRT